MLGLIHQVKNSTQLRFKKIHKFQAKIQLYLDCGPYVVKTAENARELIESFKLRHEVFNNEFREIPGPGLDFDKYDYYFDHLIIVHKETKAIIGTYRLNSSQYSQVSYTAKEFDLTMLRFFGGNQLELGRACIKKEFRKGAVISLLWRGIAEYMKTCEADILFGCSSLKINNTRESALVYRYLQQNGHVGYEFRCQPTRKFAMKDFDAWYAYFGPELTKEQAAEADQLVPSLLRSYLKLGAKVVCEPAFDREFDCIDLLTVLKKENLVKSLADRFGVAR